MELLLIKISSYFKNLKHQTLRLINTINFTQFRSSFCNCLSLKRRRHTYAHTLLLLFYVMLCAANRIRYIYFKNFDELSNPLNATKVALKLQDVYFYIQF